MTGRELQDAIVECAHLLGWHAVHLRPGRSTRGWRTALAYDGAGWPDLTLVRERVVFAEIKGTRDTLRSDQTAWLGRLEDAGAEVHLWTPIDWQTGVVDEVLR